MRVSFRRSKSLKTPRQPLWLESVVPTAPRFWHWKSLPLPKLVPRELEIHDDDEHLDEWKGQLVAASLAGIFTVGAIFGPTPWAPWLFVGAYLAGSWFTVVEVWELLQQRRLDVHFLMLAVAAGSAAIGEWKEGAILLFLFSMGGCSGALCDGAHPA
jgi:Cd2+/Zn2+-exporting ATPase